MKYLAILAAFLPSILADPIGYDFKVNLLTMIPELVMTAPGSASISYNSASDRREYDGVMLSVVGYMTFTETNVPQTYEIRNGQEWSGRITVEVYDTAGLREADAALLPWPGHPKEIAVGWVTDIPAEFDVSIEDFIDA